MNPVPRLGIWPFSRINMVAVAAPSESSGGSRNSILGNCHCLMVDRLTARPPLGGFDRPFIGDEPYTSSMKCISPFLSHAANKALHSNSLSKQTAEERSFSLLFHPYNAFPCRRFAHCPVISVCLAQKNNPSDYRMSSIQFD